MFYAGEPKRNHGSVWFCGFLTQVLPPQKNLKSLGTCLSGNRRFCLGLVFQSFQHGIQERIGQAVSTGTASTGGLFKQGLSRRCEIKHASPIVSLKAFGLPPTQGNCRTSQFWDSQRWPLNGQGMAGYTSNNSDLRTIP